MKIKLMTVLLTIAVLPATFAASKTNKIKSNKKIKRFARTVVDESMANREGKDYTVNYAAGYSFGTATNSIEVGKHLDLNSIITLQITNFNPRQAQIGNTDEAQQYWDRDRKGSAASVGLKKFVSNSFYYKPQIYARSQEIINSTTSIRSNGVTTFFAVDKAKFTDIGASFKIGNQWQWKNFTLGCDWIGLTRSLGTTAKVGKINQKQLNSGSFLNFYMGFTF